MKLRGFVAGAVLLVLAGRAFGADADEPPVPDFRFVEPLPEVVAAAQKASIPVTGIEAKPDRSGLLAGDTLSVLVCLNNGDEMKQWLLELAAEDLTEQDKQLPPLGGAHLYSSTGHEFYYGGTRRPLRLRIIGPFKGGKDERAFGDKITRVLVNSDYLALGFDRACAAYIRIAAAEAGSGGADERAGFGGSYLPFSTEQIQAGQKMARRTGLTQEEERAFLGTLPALFEFLHVARHVPGLAEIMLRVMDIPWWSIVTHGAKAPEVTFDYLPRFREIDAGAWNLPGKHKVYALAFVLQLNGAPSLTCQLAVTEPRPPLLTSAGIVGLAAQEPDGKGAYLMMRVVAARRGP